MNDSDFSIIGYDYGIKPIFMCISDFGFADSFNKAKCNGIVYGFREEANGERIPVQIQFLFENEQAAENLFDIFLNWSKHSKIGGDAITIDFIENKDGSYTLSISPEIDSFLDRTLPQNYRNKVNPMMVIMSQFKKIDALGRNYVDFKANYKKAKSIAVGYVIGDQHALKKHGKKYFTKNNFEFFKEDEIPPGKMAVGHNATEDIATADLNLKASAAPPKDSLETISLRRIKEIKELLPITYNKLSNLWLGEIQKELSSKYDRDLIIQAICNLTIFERLKLSKDNSIDTAKQDFSVDILGYLVSNYETFDSFYPSDDFYTEALIITQIENDKKELIKYLN